MHRARLLLLLLSLAALACEDTTNTPTVVIPPPTPDALPTVDQALGNDAAPVDAEVVDAQAEDAQTIDARVNDASDIDAAPPMLDAAPPLPDAAPILDAAIVDALPVDAGPACGDGIQEGAEACDDGNALDGDYCAADCRMVTGRCGDGVLQNIEFCDDGRIMDGCDVTHDGGDGTCVPRGECVDGFVLEGEDCVAIDAAADIEIFVANDCTMQVVPPRVEVARGRTVTLTYLNRSRDYPVDVWLSYGGGFLDLPIGQSWPDRFVHCTGPRRPRQAWADISTACSEHRLVISCL